MTGPNVQNAYREAAVRSASEVQLVIMMYDMIVQDLRRAINAIQSNDVEARSAEIKHAIAVLEQLQGTLNMERGGSAARHMDQLYSIARAKILEAHIKNSEAMLRAQMVIFSDLREAWHKIEQGRTGIERPPVAAPGARPVPPSVDLAGEPVSCEWSA
ncbi:MAG TPA: flagellar export chaperone FliS [Terriglobales bacterium]|nr:flagellar export chaperone FliS [Terriglobales bacterium]